MGYEISGKIWVLSVVWIFDSFLYFIVSFLATFMERKCRRNSYLFGSCGNGIVLHGCNCFIGEKPESDFFFAVSPLRALEYVCSKVLSLSAIALLVATVLAVAAKCSFLPLLLLGTFLSSVMFTLSGMIIATKITSLNQFILATVPVEIIAFVPAVLHLFNVTPEYIRIYPANVCMDLIYGREFSVMGLILVIVVIVLLFWAAYKCVLKMWQNQGGVKL